MEPQPVELEPGEAIHAVGRASFRGATAASTRATFALGSARIRRRAYQDWVDAAVGGGFPVAPADMIVAVSDRRLLIGRPTFFGRAPRTYLSALSFARIADVAAVRHGVVVGIAIALVNGHIVEIEALRSRQLRRLVHELNVRRQAPAAG